MLKSYSHIKKKNQCGHVLVGDFRKSSMLQDDHNENRAEISFLFMVAWYEPCSLHPTR